MCTAISLKTRCHYFGRNLDLERSYGECVAVTPRNFPFAFRHLPPLDTHYAMLGMACVVQGIPLYYEATNEKGLSIAGLNFPGYTHYSPDIREGSIAPFELIPWLLGKCADIRQVRQALSDVTVSDISFSPELPVTPLHWLISDREGSLTLECTQEGMRLKENPVGVLTNSPPLEFHLENLKKYSGLNTDCSNRCALGDGALGLPGDFTSPSRFVRAVFVKENSVCGEDDRESVNRFFHILRSVAMPMGCVRTPEGELEYTRYSCCCNTDTGVYSYTTYENQTPRSVELHAHQPDASEISVYPI